MQMMVQGWLVFELTSSAFLLGLVGFCQFVPRLIFGSIGGVFVDRMDRRRILILTNGLAMIHTFVFALLVALDWIDIWGVVLLVLILGTINSLNQTAGQSLIVSLVPKKELLNAIALNTSAINFTKVIGPSLAGILIHSIGISGCLFINATSFIAILCALHLMRVDLYSPPKQGKGFLTEWKEGYEHVRGSHRIWSVTLLSYVLAVFGQPYTRFLPIFARDILKAGARGFGFLLAAPGLGAGIAALMLAFLGDVKKKQRVIYWSGGIFALSLVAFSFSKSMLFSLTLLTLVGFCQMSFRTLARIIIQTETPLHLLGRVMGLFTIDRGLWSLGTLLIGTIASLLGAPLGLAASALVCGGASALFPLMRETRRREPIAVGLSPARKIIDQGEAPTVRRG
jgi:MFS family permease